MLRHFTACAGLLLAFTLFAGFSHPACAATELVPSQYATIQAAINAAANGDTVLISDGTYTGPGNVDLDFGGRNITVTSQNGPATTIIDCGGTTTVDHRSFYLHSGETSAVISGFTIQHAEVGGSFPGSPNYPGGAILSYGGLTVQNCIIKNNIAGLGGGLYGSLQSGSMSVTNCVFTGNTAGVGGGMYLRQDGNGTISVVNCTVTGNTATGAGAIPTSGGIAAYAYPYPPGSTGISLINTIVYGDTGGEIANNGATPTGTFVNYCDVQGGYAGIGNINADPLFIFPPYMGAAPDLHLKTGSPCVGAGTPSGAPATDLDGKIRPIPPSIGAYEVGAVSKTTTATTLTSSLNPSALGQPVTFTANVAASVGGGVPMGTVTFFVDGLPQTPVSVSNGYYAAYTTSSLSVGTHTITAAYSGDGNFGSSTSPALTQTVNQAATTTTTTTLSSSLNPSAYGQYVILTATVSGSSPIGTVTFTDAVTGAALDTETVYPNGTASFYTYSLAIGSHQIVASYSGDSANSASKSAVLTQVVGRAAATATLSSSLNPAVVGQSVTFNGSISATGGPLTGTITLAVDGVTQSPLSINTSYSYQSGVYTSSFSYTPSALPAGSHSVTLAYGGDPNNTPCTSAPLTQTVSAVSATTTTLISSLNPSVYGQFVYLTASVSGSNPTGTVTFTDTTTGAALGTATLSGGIASLYAYRLAVGTHQIVASYGGDIGNTASTSPALTQVVAKDGTATLLSSSLNPSLGGQSVTVTAELTGASATEYLYPTPTGTFTFTVDGKAQTPVSISSGYYSNGYYVSFTIPAPSLGSHTITAAYSGDANFAPSMSPALTQTVNQAATTTTLSSSLNPARYGQQITLTATVSGSSPSGNVTFTDTTTGAALGSVPLSGSGTASLSIYGLWGGGHQIVASYGGDTNNTPSVSAALTETVANVSTATTLGSSVNPSLLGQSVTVTATVTGSPVGTPTGTVTFTVDGTAQAPVTLSGGTASYTTSTLTVGPHTITAAYSGDANFAPSMSPALTQTVLLAAPTQLTATAGYRQVKLTWAAAASPSAVTYSVYRSLAAGGAGATPLAANLTPAAYTDTRRPAGPADIYTVRASVGTAQSGPSPEASATPALPAPANLVAVAGVNQVTLSWTAPAGVPSPTYSVYRGTTPGGETFYKSAGTATSFVNGLVTAGTRYFYTVKTVVGSETSAASGEADAIPTAPVPAAPTALKAAAGDGRVVLSWTAPPGSVSSYTLYRGVSASALTVIASGLTATGDTDTGVTDGTTYFYAVAAVSSGGTGPKSSVVSAAPVGVPAAPTGLTATASGGQVLLSWTAPAGPVSSYSVYRGTASGAETFYKTAGTATSFVNGLVTKGTKYYYTVRALSSSGTSPASNEASATP